jgi:ParB family chromosome partitioning protein
MGMFDKLNKAAADTFTEDIQMIDIDNLVKSEDNFFDVTGIEEFAETILGQGGVKENLIVRPLDDENYEIISGHRRTAAVRFLLEKGETVSQFLPCLVMDYKDDDEKKLDIVLMNVSARVISDSEMWKSYEVVNDILQKKKELGEKFGRVQEKLSEILGISTGKIANIQNIAHNAIPQVKEAIENGNISINTASQIAKLDTKKQKEIVENADISNITPKLIKELTDEKCITNDTFSENNYNNTDDEKCITNDTFSENNYSNTDDEKCITNDTFSENTDNSEYDTDYIPPMVDNIPKNKAENDKNSSFSDLKNQNSEPENFIQVPYKIRESNIATLKKYKNTLITSIDLYLNMADDDEEIQVFNALKSIISDIEEQELNKIRFGK